jgi:hypothetical protein
VNARLKQRVPADGEAANERLRRCAVDGGQHPQSELIRFVVGPDDAVVPDLKQRLPGRGVWVSCKRDVLDQAVRKGHFARAFKRRVTVDPELSQLVEDLLKQGALSRLSLANKAGAVVAGFAKIERALQDGRVAGLLHASDGGDDGCRKLDGKYMKNLGQARAEGGIARCFNVDELSLALGRSNVVHAAVIEVKSARALLDAVARLDAFRAASVKFNESRTPGCGEE